MHFLWFKFIYGVIAMVNKVIDNKKISDCCKKKVCVSTGGEGTSCHMCSECNNPCDLFVDKEAIKKPYDNFRADIKKLAEERVKYVEDYIKFWLAVNAPESLESITPEILARDFQLLIKQYEDYTTCYQMVPHNQAIIDKEEYERLKRLHDNVKKCISGLESQLACHLAVSEETQMLENVKNLLEDLCK